jgi:hypothetical protein
MTTVSKPRTKTKAGAKPSGSTSGGRIVLILDGRLLPAATPQQPHLAAAGR